MQAVSIISSIPLQTAKHRGIQPTPELIGKVKSESAISPLANTRLVFELGRLEGVLKGLPVDWTQFVDQTLDGYLDIVRQRIEAEQAVARRKSVLERDTTSPRALETLLKEREQAVATLKDKLTDPRQLVDLTLEGLQRVIVDANSNQGIFAFKPNDDLRREILVPDRHSPQFLAAFEEPTPAVHILEGLIEHIQRSDADGAFTRALLTNIGVELGLQKLGLTDVNLNHTLAEGAERLALGVEFKPDALTEFWQTPSPLDTQITGFARRLERRSPATAHNDSLVSQPGPIHLPTDDDDSLVSQPGPIHLPTDDDDSLVSQPGPIHLPTDDDDSLVSQPGPIHLPTDDDSLASTSLKPWDPRVDHNPTIAFTRPSNEDTVVKAYSSHVKRFNIPPTEFELYKTTSLIKTQVDGAIDTINQHLESLGYSPLVLLDANGLVYNIYTAIHALEKESNPVNLASIAEQLPKNNATDVANALLEDDNIDAFQQIMECNSDFEATLNTLRQHALVFQGTNEQVYDIYAAVDGLARDTETINLENIAGRLSNLNERDIANTLVDQSKAFSKIRTLVPDISRTLELLGEEAREYLIPKSDAPSTDGNDSNLGSTVDGGSVSLTEDHEPTHSIAPAISAPSALAIHSVEGSGDESSGAVSFTVASSPVLAATSVEVGDLPIISVETIQHDGAGAANSTGTTTSDNDLLAGTVEQGSGTTSNSDLTEIDADLIAVTRQVAIEYLADGTNALRVATSTPDEYWTNIAGQLGEEAETLLSNVGLTRNHCDVVWSYWNTRRHNLGDEQYIDFNELLLNVSENTQATWSGEELQITLNELNDLIQQVDLESPPTFSTNVDRFILEAFISQAEFPAQSYDEFIFAVNQNKVEVETARGNIRFSDLNLGEEELMQRLEGIQVGIDELEIIRAYVKAGGFKGNGKSPAPKVFERNITSTKDKLRMYGKARYLNGLFKRQGLDPKFRFTFDTGGGRTTTANNIFSRLESEVEQPA